jgi:hypothetical protein
MTRNGKTIIIECCVQAEELGVSQYSIYEWKKKFLPLAALPGSKGKTSTSVGLVEDVEELQTLAACIYQKVLLRKRPRPCENFQRLL